MVETGKGDLSSFYTWRLAGIGGRKGSIVISFFFFCFFFPSKPLQDMRWNEQNE